jgi:hypothetical protein
MRLFARSPGTMADHQTGSVEWCTKMAVHCRSLASINNRPRYNEYLQRLAEAFEADAADILAERASGKASGKSASPD